MKNNSSKRSPLNWAQLGEHIALGGPPYHAWPDAPWQRVVVSDNDKQSPRVQAYELTEAPYSKRLEEIIELWLQDKPIPNLDTTGSFLLGLRFQVVGSLLMSFGSVGSLMPHPPSDEIGISRQFLIDWWKKNGAFYAVGSECAEFTGRK